MRSDWRHDRKQHVARRSDNVDASFPEQAQELLHLVLGYAKQETLDPIRDLGRFLGFGLAAALIGSLGLVLLFLGGLRLLQTETGSVFEGRRSWIPYLPIVVVSAAIAGAAIKAATRAPPKRADHRADR